MNNILIFLFISIGILVLSAITISLAPIINDISNISYNSPKDLDCEIFSNQQEISKYNLDTFQKLKTFKNICKRQKATHNLEYASLIISVFLSFLCANFSLLSFFKVEKGHQNKIGLFGLITGIIGFILTLIYICFSGYVFTNDMAFGIINMNDFGGTGPELVGGILKLFPNGAKYKYNGNRYITSYEENIGYNSQYLRYNELGDKQYNYDKDIYIKYMENLPENRNSINGCNIGSAYLLTNYNIKINSCDYLFTQPYNNSRNKYLYDRWVATLILSVFIIVLHLALAIFGILVFIDKETTSEEMGHDLVIYGNK